MTAVRDWSNIQCSDESLGNRQFILAFILANIVQKYKLTLLLHKIIVAQIFCSHQSQADISNNVLQTYLGHSI